MLKFHRVQKTGVLRKKEECLLMLKSFHLFLWCIPLSRPLSPVNFYLSSMQEKLQIQKLEITSYYYIRSLSLISWLYVTSPLISLLHDMTQRIVKRKRKSEKNPFFNVIAVHIY